MVVVEKEDVEPLGHSSHPESHPLLLFCHGKRRQKQILYSISKKSHSPYPVPAMRNKIILGSGFGWFLLHDYNTYDCCLLNFGSEEVMNLPNTSCRLVNGVFSSAPTDPDCRVVFLDRRDHVVRYCRVGDDKYLKQEMDIDGSYLLREGSFNGKIYGVTSKGYALVEVQFGARNLRFHQVVEKLGNPGRSDVVVSASYLVESGGELLYVHQIYMGMVDKYDFETLEFKVFRANFERREWEKMESLGDRALFHSSAGGISCSASQANNVKGNCIYFVETGLRNLYVFDMEDGSISTSEPCRAVDNDNLTLHWVMM